MKNSKIHECVLFFFYIGGQNWASGEDDHFVALAEYDFDGDNDEELSFRRGTRINIAPKGNMAIVCHFTVDTPMFF